MAQYELNLRDYLRIARKRRYIIIFTTICLGFFSYFFANMQKPVPVYTSASSVKIERSTTMTGLYLQNLSYDDSDIMETQSTVIKSLPLMEKVTKRMGSIDENLSPEEIRSNREYLNQVLRYKGMVSTEIEGWTNILNISVNGTNPKEVMNLANTVASVFKEENTKDKNKRTIDARKFIEKRLREVETDLKNVQHKIRTFKEENKFIDEMMEVTGLLDNIKESEFKLEVIVNRITTTQLLIRELEKQAKSHRDKAVSLVGYESDPIFFNQNNKRNELLTQREVLLVNFTDQFPQVINLDIQLKELESNMLGHLREQESILTKSRKSIESKANDMTNRHKRLPQMAFTLDDLEYELENTRELYRDLSTKHQEILIKSSEMIEEVSIVRPALEPQYAINPPKIGATTGIGTMVGLILGLVIAFVLETLDTSISTIEDVEGFLGIPVLGVIPLIRPEDIRATLAKKGDLAQSEESMEMNARLISHFAPKSNLAESFRALRTSIKFLVLEKNIKTLMVSSSTAREGKSTTIANMALTLAQIGSRVLLIDADLRKPMVARIFGIEKEPGVSDIILGNYEWRDTVKTVTDIMMGRLGMEDIMTSPGIDNLNIITAGTHSPNTTELVSSQRMSDFLNEAKEDFDVILVDCPPVLQATDSVIISTKVDAVVLIYWAGKVQRGALKRAKTQLDNVNATTLGLVLNGLKPEVSSDYNYYGYYSYYGYGDAGTETREPGMLKKIRDRFRLPIFVSKLSIKINNFIEEKKIKERLDKATKPARDKLKHFTHSRTILKVLQPFKRACNILGKNKFVKAVIDIMPFNIISKKQFLFILEIILTVGAVFLLIAGVIWQIFFS